jgi:hypothetical protein
LEKKMTDEERLKGIESKGDVDYINQEDFEWLISEVRRLNGLVQASLATTDEVMNAKFNKTRAEEREACAKVVDQCCESIESHDCDHRQIAAAIRARGK